MPAAMGGQHDRAEGGSPCRTRAASIRHSNSTRKRRLSPKRPRVASKSAAGSRTTTLGTSSWSCTGRPRRSRKTPKARKSSSAGSGQIGRLALVKRMLGEIRVQPLQRGVRLLDDVASTPSARHTLQHLHENRLPACLLTRRVRGRRRRSRCHFPRSGSNRDHLNTRRFRPRFSGLSAAPWPPTHPWQHLR